MANSTVYSDGRKKIIAVDFDGCLVTNNWPDIGEPIPATIQKLESEVAQGAKVILWTCRVGDDLKRAVEWCADNHIPIDAINQNVPEIIAEFGGDPRKVFATEYWDDRAVLMSEKDIGDFSDGFHTFNDLYEQRLYLFAALVNTFPDIAWKSYKHEDGQLCFGGGWFIVAISTPEGDYSYHYENKYWDLFRCEELTVGKKWDGHTAADVKRLLSLADELSSQSSWAENEVRIACEADQKESEGEEDDGFLNYTLDCYRSALKAFKSLTRDGHTGFSISVTKHVLNRLIDGKPLRPIEDTDDVWTDVTHKGRNGKEPEFMSYQCNRMSSVFKDVYANGKVVYRDVDNHVCIDVVNQSTYHSSLVQNILDEMFPISMPYMPGDQIRVYCEDFLVDAENGDFDTVGIYYLIKDKENVQINRFFKEDKETGWKEILRDEYDARKERKIGD